MILQTGDWCAVSCRTMADPSSRFRKGDDLYMKFLKGEAGSCKACGKTEGNLLQHLQVAVVKILCPADGCSAMTQDRPGPLDRHWKFNHQHLGERPMALRVALPTPRCKVRWSRKTGQKERHLHRARVDSLVPSAQEWRESQAIKSYKSEGGTTGYDAKGIVTLDTRFEHPKKRVRDYVGVVPMRYWSQEPTWWKR